jgi:hypothetical protein
MAMFKYSDNLMLFLNQTTIMFFLNHIVDCIVYLNWHKYFDRNLKISYSS